MPMRVIAGSAKGRRLKMVPGDTTRPVMDRVKEALFNIIGRDIQDSIFLDLFAGTGSVGIEALSRGARKAVFVEREKRAIETILDNLTISRLADRSAIRKADVLSVLKQSPGEKYDFIYVAPPQYKGIWLQVLQTLDENPAWIPQGTTIIVQIDPSEESPVQFKHLETSDQRRYGRTLLWFFSVGENIPEDIVSKE